MSGGQGNVLVGLPTGTGKSLCIAELARRIVTQWAGQKVVMATHVMELIEQNLDKLKQLWPTAPAGVFSAALKRKEAYMPIVYGGIDTMVGNGHLFGKVQILLIDEAHLVSPKDNGRYKKFIEELKVSNPKLKVIGFTATPYRVGQGKLTDGDDAIFDEIVFDGTEFKAFNWFLDQGYLCRLSPFPTNTQFDLSKVGMVGGEFNQGQLQAAVDEEHITRECLIETINKASDRDHWLIFASGVSHAKNICDMLNEEFDISATYVTSVGMKTAERTRRINDFLSGRVKVLVNNGILTTGFDFPALDCIVMMRATNSPGLWVQMLGRGTRPFYAPGFDLSTQEGRLAAIAASDKRDCLVLDFAGNAARLGPINDPVIPKPPKEKKAGDVPIKICPACGMYNHASVRFCAAPACGHEFIKELKIDLGASEVELIATEKKLPDHVVEIFKIEHIVYSMYNKRSDGSPSIRVSYHCAGYKLFEEFIRIEGKGNRARRWWKERGGGQLPETTIDALRLVEDLAKPIAIHVDMTGKYKEIINYEFEPSYDKASASTSTSA